MHRTRKNILFCIVSLFTVFSTLNATELPAAFPADVPIANYMKVVNVVQVRDDMMIDLHAPGQTLASVVEWFQSGLTTAGWQSDGETISERQAILAFSKNGRTCGVSITNFVLNSSMQMDDSTKGITLQLTAAKSPTERESESASEAADSSSR